MAAEPRTPRDRQTVWARPAWGVVLVVAYTALVCLPLLLVAVRRPPTGEAFLRELGKAFALAGIVILALQFAVSARLRWVERPFGLDLLFGYHKAMGVFALALIAAHPVLLALGGSGWGLLLRPDLPWYIVLGKLALLLLLLQVIAALFRQSLRLKFERWRRFHNVAIVIFGLGFVHSSYVGSDFHLAALRALWMALLALVCVSYAYHKFVVPAVLRRRAYRVTEVSPETHDVWTLQMEPPPGRRRFDYRPGQFQFLTLLRGDRGLPVEEHPFTIASSPTQPHLALSIKASGDFTATVGQTRPGDRAALEGPFGRFSHTLHPQAGGLVLVAGGIGITPLMSMLRYMRDTQAEADVLLLDANRTEADIAFREELEAMTGGGRLRLRVVHVLSEADDRWQGERGYLDREMIQRLVGEGLREKTYYVCGPPPMMRQVIAALRALGVASARIAYERFSL